MHSLELKLNAEPGFPGKSYQASKEELLTATLFGVREEESVVGGTLISYIWKDVRYLVELKEGSCDPL